MSNLELNLKNVGLIKEANIKINGLTVVAGENDTGKSTVGKSLFFINNPSSRDLVLSKFNDVFYFTPQENTEINFNKNLFNIKKSNFKNTLITIFIETPIVVSLFHLFSDLDTIQSDTPYEINYPHTLRNLYKQLKLKLKHKTPSNKNQSQLEIKYETSLDKDGLVNNLKDIINGEFIYVALKELVFKRGNQEFHINSVATGIKNFGILQLLIKNNYLSKDSILIVDEPEVHLHPKWQLAYAKFIV